MADQLEVLVIEQVLDVLSGAGEEIVDAEDIGALRQQPFAQMRPEKPGPARHQNAPLKMHTPSRRHAIFEPADAGRRTARMRFKATRMQPKLLL
jgi:hypothetical protein